MKPFDWALIACPLLIVLATGVLTQRSMRGVADFLSARRLAGRYLLAVARGEMGAGAVVFVAVFELISKAGFTVSWWKVLEAPIVLVVAMFGFVIYRYRETRAMTLAQFFEIRYSRSFRIFAGALGFVAGILNFGIIPAVGSRFLVYFLQLPPELTVGHWTLPTYVPLMALFLSITTFITLSGGLITVMVTDCIEGMLSQLLYLVVIVGLISVFSWSQVAATLTDRPAGQSMLNPFDSLGNRDFNVWYIMIGVVLATYGTMAWQNASAYNAAALTPHESRMAGLLGMWREMGKTVVAALLAVCALTFLSHPAFAGRAAEARQIVAQIADPHVRDQMRVPIALTHMLPTGVRGAFCAVLLMGVFGGDSTHLHSWSGILVQDVLVPLRRRPLSPRAHLLALRLAVVGVAVFAFCFGTLFRQTEYVLMWWQITTAVYVGGAGAAIIGGLYWSRGTTAGAWAALLTGSTLAVGGIVVRQRYGAGFPLNGQQLSLLAAFTASAVYVVTSLVTCRQPFNMDRMLHRGPYALADTPGHPPLATAPGRGGWTLARVIGIDRHFSRGDRWIAGGLFAWYLTWVVVVVAISVAQLYRPWSAAAWAQYWMIAGVGLPLVIAVVTAFWFTYGGARDIAALFRRLRETPVNVDEGGEVAVQPDEQLPFALGGLGALPSSESDAALPSSVIVEPAAR